MSKFRVGDIALRPGAGKSQWKWRVVGLRGHWLWQKCLLDAIPTWSDALLEEYSFRLYKFTEGSGLADTDHNATIDTANPPKPASTRKEDK